MTMIRNRTNSQKPDDELIQKFQRTFSDIIPKPGPGEIVDQASNELGNPSRSNTNFNAMRSNEQSLRNTPDIRMSSPFVDPTSLDFLPFSNQPHNLYPQNSNYNGFHSQHAGDLHTPLGLGVANPFSQQMDNTAPMDTDAANMGLNQFGQQFFSSPFQNPQPFAQQQSFAPSAFQQDPGFDPMEETVEKSSLNELELQDPSIKVSASDVDMASQSGQQNAADQKFRYNTTLRAPTAMTKNPNDIPISYLNKGQAYSLSVVDSNPPPAGSQMVRYRTSVRVTFQEEEQRLKPGACWQLWKEGRGASEAQQRGDKIQALEYVDPFQGGNEDRKARQVQVESTTVDGFCVTWTANPSTGAFDCTVPVRFNFLSTDFSHSKGVKGIPVRLCAKTEIISGVDSTGTDQKAAPELCFCQVKLFRDHGAERKLSNDVAHVKKTIEKLKQQIVQAEMGGGNSGKRKRANGSIAFSGGDHRLSKINKHKRTWSMDSRDGVDRVSLEDDLHAKLAAMQEMFTSTNPVSSLNMQADKQDDPDLFPVKLPSEVKSSSAPRRQNLQNLRGPNWALEGTTTSPVTGSPQNVLTHPSYDSGYQTSLSSRGSSLPVSENSSQPIKVQRANSGSTISTGYIEAVDIDPTYRPPPERRVKPIACFYLRFCGNGTQEDYYRAVYLSERTVKDLMDKIAVKRPMDVKRVLRVLLVKKTGLSIMVDDDVVRELPDGQDMEVEISETSDTSESPDDSRPPAFEVRLAC